MPYLRLADLIIEGKTTKAKCPRCNGLVTVPNQVQLVLGGGPPVRYEPYAKCHTCGVGFAWHTEKNPVRATAGKHSDIGKTDVWYADRELEAPTPTIMEE